MAENENSNWFVSASVISYIKDPNKMKSGISEVTTKPVITCIKEKQIAVGDKVVYYAFERNLVLGLFEVISDQKDGLDYNDQKMVYYDLKRISPISDKFLDIAKLSEQGLDKFEAFNDGLLSTNLSFEDQVRKIPENDYNKIKEYLTRESLLSKIDIDEKKVAILSATLDFYGDRATSFASLFVASIFGLVTLSAIIQTLNASNAADLVIIHLSMIPFVVFAGAGWYTLQKYFHYGDIAERIRVYGLIYPYYANLREIKEVTYTTNNGIKRGEKDDLVNCLIGLKKDKSTDEKGNGIKKENVLKWVKKELLEKESRFVLLYFLVIGLLGVIVYYCAFSIA